MADDAATISADAAQEVAGIEDALHILLTTAIDIDNERASRPRPVPDLSTFKVYTIGQLADLVGTKGKAGDIIKNPVGIACRMAVKVLGQRLYEIGGLQLMEEALDRVAERDERWFGRRVDIMDKRWDGIGREGSRAGWCA
jgi:hypothetical protein